MLHQQILEVDVDALHVHLHSHAVVEECRCDVLQLLQALYVGFYYFYLFGSALCKIVYTGYLFYEVVARLVV